MTAEPDTDLGETEQVSLRKAPEAAGRAGWQPRSRPCVSSLISAPCMRTGAHRVMCALDGVQGSSRKRLHCSTLIALK